MNEETVMETDSPRRECVDYFAPLFAGRNGEGRLHGIQVLPEEISSLQQSPTMRSGDEDHGAGFRRHITEGEPCGKKLASVLPFLPIRLILMPTNTRLYFDCFDTGCTGFVKKLHPPYLNLSGIREGACQLTQQRCVDCLAQRIVGKLRLFDLPKGARIITGIPKSLRRFQPRIIHSFAYLLKSARCACQQLRGQD